MSEIDDLDRKILSILMKDANVPYTEIAKKLFVSGGTVHVRMKKMEQMGIVKGSHLDVDYSMLGYDITAFLGIYLEKSSLYDDVAKLLVTIPEVVDAHYTTGNYSVFVKIICRDTDHLREILHDKIQQIGGIQRTETFISLQESIARPLIMNTEEP
ncbi:MAG: Lrp/AsnC ligand binding domain-containing protein [Saprospiraceae bacterium]